MNKPTYGRPINILLPDGSVKTIILEKRGKTQTKYGLIYHENIVLKHWGEKIKTTTGAIIRLFPPTLQDIEMNLFKRSSQVIYPKDSVIMIMLSGIKKGSKIGEAGVGSGYLTAYLLDKIGNEGTYRGFDIRKDMIETAIKNLNLIYPKDKINIALRDIRKGIDDDGYEAFFLDMPDPWNALQPLYNSLIDGGRIIIFVPTLNQILKIVRTIREDDKYHIEKIIEANTREYQKNPEALRPETIQVTHTGYIVSLIKQV